MEESSFFERQLGRAARDPTRAEAYLLEIGAAG